MIIDKSTLFSDDQDIGQIVGDYDSSLILDSVKDGGPYEDVWLFLKISEAVVGTSSTVEFKLRTSDDNFGSSDVLLWSSGAIAEADLTINKVIARIRLPLGVLRYLKMEYSVAVATTTAGTVMAALVPDVQNTFEVS